MSKQDTQETKMSKGLRTIQQTSSDIENLVGRMPKSLKHQLSEDSPVDVEIKRKNLSTKETQASQTNKITVEDLTNPEEASIEYWRILADKRRDALQEVLDENESLRSIITALKEEKKQLKQMLEESNSFIEVIKEELANSSKDDTGIDVNDCSTADEVDDSHEQENNSTNQQD